MVADGVVCWSKGHAPPFEKVIHRLIQAGGRVEHAAAAAPILILPAIVELDKAVEGVKSAATTSTSKISHWLIWRWMWKGTICIMWR